MEKQICRITWVWVRCVSEADLREAKDDQLERALRGAHSGCFLSHTGTHSHLHWHSPWIAQSGGGVLSSEEQDSVQYMLTAGEQEAATCRRSASVYLSLARGFLGGSDGEESAPSAGDLGSVPGLGRFPGKGNGNPLQFSCLENPMDRGAWWATVHGVSKSQTELSS